MLAKRMVVVAKACLRTVARDPVFAAVVLLLWTLIALFILYPLACLLARAFTEDGALTLRPLITMAADPNHRVAFANSLLLAFLVGAGGTALGFLFAFTAARARLGRRTLALFDSATLLPLVSPPFTTSVAILFSFGPRGLITYHLLGIKTVTAYGLTSTALAEIVTYFPIAYLTLRPILAGVDPSIENAAFSLGASRWHVFRTVTLPLAIPGIANAFLLLFAASLADFATPLILAGNAFPVLPTQAFLQITGLFDLRGGAILSFFLLVPAVGVYILQRYWVAGRSYVTVTGRTGPQTSAATVAPLARKALVWSCVLVSLAVLYFYALLLYASVVVAFGANHAWTLDHYRVIFTEGLPAIRDTLIIAGLGMPLGGVYGVLLGYLVARRHFVGRHAMEVVSMLNYALPGTIVGIAYLIAFNTPPFAITGTAIIIVACYVFRYSPTGIRATIALLQQIDRSIEEASQSLGAGSGITFRRVTLPLIMPAFFTGLGVVFIRSMTAISATIFLISISWTLITVRILENMTELALGPAAAFSMLVIVIVFIAIMGIGALLARFRTAGGARLENILGG